MAANIYDLSTTAASNTTIDGVDVSGPTGKVKDGDNVMRSLGAYMAQVLDDLGAVNTIAGTDTITCTLASEITAYATGQMFRFIAANTNTGAATMNVNSIGAKAIRKISGGTDVALSAGDIAAGETYLVIYRATANSAAGGWVLIGSSVAAATTTSQGIVELATAAEALTGTDTSRAVTPSGLYYPTLHLSGLTLSNNSTDATNDIDIAAGTARDGSDTVNIKLASALTKRLDAAWAVGTNQGGLDTGSIANGTYHVWLIMRSDTGVVDVLFSTSATSPTMPTNYDYKRYIAPIIRESAAIVTFQDLGEGWFTRAPVTDRSSTSATASTLIALSVPDGIACFPLTELNYLVGNGVTLNISYGSASVGSANTNVAYHVTNTGAGCIGASAGPPPVFRTNTSKQIYFAQTGVPNTFTLVTIGWRIVR